MVLCARARELEARAVKIASVWKDRSIDIAPILDMAESSYVRANELSTPGSAEYLRGHILLAQFYERWNRLELAR